MKTPFRLPLFLLLLGSPAMLAAQSVQDFQLPPNPTPSATPEAEGPVDPQGGLPSRPRVIVTPTPTPSPSAAEAAEGSEAAERPQLSSGSERQEPSPVRELSHTVAGQTATPALPEAEEGAIARDPVPDQPPPSGAVPSGPPTQAQSEGISSADESRSWLWPAIGGGLLASFALGFLFARRRREIAPPLIERPKVGGAGLGPPAKALTIQAEPIKLTQSVMNATLHYRLVLTNRSGTALGAADVGVDMVGAHGSAPVEEQVANRAHKLDIRHRVERISPRQSVRYEGQLAVPLAQARIIRQGNAALFVPLLRVRIDGIGDEPVLKTFVVGQGTGDGGRVMPFRLDEGPRTYQPIAARVID